MLLGAPDQQDSTILSGSSSDIILSRTGAEGRLLEGSEASETFFSFSSPLSFGEGMVSEWGCPGRTAV